jgi:hypothetical protein
MPNRNQNRDAGPTTARGAVQTLQQLRESGQDIVLTINGQAPLHVQDATSYQKLLELVDRLECIEALREGLKEVEEGKCLSLEQAKEALAKKHGIPS